jgi:hypothetical protein
MAFTKQFKLQIPESYVVGSETYLKTQIKFVDQMHVHPEGYKRFSKVFTHT